MKFLLLMMSHFHPPWYVFQGSKIIIKASFLKKKKEKKKRSHVPNVSIRRGDEGKWALG